MSNPRALILEPSLPIASTLRQYLEAARFEVRVEQRLEDVLRRGQDGQPAIAFCSTTAFDAAAVVAELKRLHPQCSVVLLFTPDQDDPDGKAHASQADGFLVGPLRKSAVLSISRAMLRLRELRQKVSSLEESYKPEGVGKDFEFFRKYLLLEVRRARRYKYPIAFLLIAFDRLDERLQGQPASVRLALMGEALSTITRSIRDIDLAVPYVESRFLAFLPNTPWVGASEVANRLYQRLAEVTAVPGMTVSVGMASFDGRTNEQQINFRSMLSDVAEALQRAQAAGGNRVEAGAPPQRRDRISIG